MVVAVLAVLALLVSACGGGGSGDNKKASDSVVIGLSYRASSLDPHHGGTYDPQYTAQIFDSLIAFDKDGKLVPGLATSWELASDALSMTLKLRDGVKFQDGATMDAEAVKMSLDRARAKESTRAQDLAVVQSVEVVDPKTVKLVFSTPGAQVLYALANEAGMIISPQVVNGDVATTPVGAGPFKLVSFTPDEVKLEKFDGYWDAKNVKPKNVTIRAMVDDGARVRALSSGQIDGGNMRPSQIKEIEAKGGVIKTGPSDLIYMMIINTAIPGLDNPDVRKALLNGVDRESINKNMQNGLCTPLLQPYTKGYTPYVADLASKAALKYDPKKVKKDLETAGHGSSNPLKIEIMTPNISVYQQLAEVLQSQYKEIGIDASVAAIDSAQANAAVRQGQYQVFVGPTNVANPDPTTFIYNYYVRKGPTTTNFSVDGAQQLLDKARSTADLTKQAPPLQDLMTKIYDAGPPIVPICAPEAVFGAVKGMEGFESPIDGAYKLKNVVVKK